MTLEYPREQRVLSMLMTVSYCALLTSKNSKERRETQLAGPDPAQSFTCYHQLPLSQRLLSLGYFGSLEPLYVNSNKMRQELGL